MAKRFLSGVVAGVDPDLFDVLDRLHGGRGEKMDVGHQGHGAPAGGADTGADSLRQRAACTLGAVTRTISQPTSARAIDWRTVAATSWVSLVVIDWTRTGLEPPTPTEPTRTSRVGRRTVRKREAQ